MYCLPDPLHRLGCDAAGLPTLPTLIYDKREEYVMALRAADASLRDASAKRDDDDEADLTVMTAYLRDLVLHQLANAVAKLAAPVH